MRETPKTTIATVLAYRRRRGWMVYNIATLQRFDFDDGFPSLRELQGLKPSPPPEQSEDQMRSNLLDWQAVMERRGGLAH